MTYTNTNNLTMKLYLLLFITLFSQSLFSQNEDHQLDTTIFKVVDEMPRFPGCEIGVMTREERKKCAEDNMLQFIYSNITYPDSAIAHGTEGRVVLQFTVDKKGQVTDTKLLKDIGDGCGEEALRVVNLMQEKNIYWRPGIKNGEAVKVYYTLPVTFKLKDYTPPAPYTIYQGDSIYLQLDKAAEFKGGEAALKTFLASEITYPSNGLDSCWSGSFKNNLLIRKDGSVELLESIDFSNLGTDFLFEIIKLIPKTKGKWTPATYQNKTVTSIYPLRVEFRPASKGCKTDVEKYELATQTVTEGLALHDEKKYAEALLKMDEALSAFPKNTEWLYFRGIVKMSLNQHAEACEDFQKIRDLCVVPWYEKWIDIVCKL